MSRTTIDFGIDLGTTNSTIAVIDGTQARVIQNKAGSGITPSAVWIDRRGNLRVGAEARQRALIDDGENGDLEFKLRMGLGEKGKKVFVRSGRTMLPEELSAEVLKTLKLDAQSNLGEQVRAAVITVPAAFEQPQIEATRKAAELAGFLKYPIVLEPVAASLAYGFQTDSENVYWLVYDFGGGTFDAALMHIRDGEMQVVNHDGDNFLGGKLLDWDIVTKKLVPAAARQYNLPDFGRGVPKWQAALGKLKYNAEEAKIEVCRTRKPHEIYIENLCTDADGRQVEFTYNLTPQEVEEISRPHIERSLILCRKTLKDRDLSGRNLDRILMVGGTTLNPWVREAVAAELGARLEFGIDPVTVVARGAAIFASNLEGPAPENIPSGAWRIQIEQERVGTSLTPDIGGRVEPLAGRSAKGFTLELVDIRSGWRSGRTTLGEEGVFMTQLFAEKRRCEYAIELSNPTGTRLQTVPDQVAYTPGVRSDAQIATQTFGIGLADGSVAQFIRKGDKLLARMMRVLKTSVPLKAGKASDVVRIPILSGEHARASRCHGIGDLLISGSDIKRDLPTGSEVEITVVLDEGQKMKVTAFVRQENADFEIAFDMQMEQQTLERLQGEAHEQRQRLAKARAKAQGVGLDKAAAIVLQIDAQQLTLQVDTLLQAAKGDRDACQQLNSKVRALAAAVDQVEDELEWPELLREAEGARREAEKMVGEHGNATEKSTLRTLIGSQQRAITAKDVELVRQINGDLWNLHFRVADGVSRWHVEMFEELKGHQKAMTNQEQAQDLISRGQRALLAGDIVAVKATNRQLFGLLPREKAAEVGKGSGVQWHAR